MTNDILTQENERKYKVWVLAAGERTYATNGLDFDTTDEAMDYGWDLHSRWMAVKRFVVLPLDKERFNGTIPIELAESEAASKSWQD